MPKVLKSLTNTEIAAAKPQKTEYMLRDGDGLALLIKPSGRKIWYFEYTPPALKKRTKISIGPYPVVTLAMARDFRLQYRRLLVQGGNDSNLLIVFYVQIMPDDFVMQLHR
ncbi:integrase arm-type DNA-binding domain-containing protein, partial [Enterobacter hormaechei]|uniref:integrase arm-type DNA-binding domain-containing protein n=1 Tax=Enterobacter hormaechei TaxID=158836 RepID=UPI00215A68D0